MLSFHFHSVQCIFKFSLKLTLLILGLFRNVLLIPSVYRYSCSLSHWFLAWFHCVRHAFYYFDSLKIFEVLWPRRRFALVFIPWALEIVCVVPTDAIRSLWQCCGELFCGQLISPCSVSCGKKRCSGFRLHLWISVCLFSCEFDSCISQLCSGVCTHLGLLCLVDGLILYINVPFLGSFLCSETSICFNIAILTFFGLMFSWLVFIPFLSACLYHYTWSEFLEGSWVMFLNLLS